MKSLVFVLLVLTTLAPQSVLAARRWETVQFVCQGPNVSAAVTIRRSGIHFRAPYTAQTSFIINGRRVNEKAASDTTFFQQEILFGGGAWRYDDSRIIYRLGGSELGLNWLSESFHLEVKEGPFGYAVGYLGHRDHEAASRTDNSAYDFSCSRR